MATVLTRVLKGTLAGVAATAAMSLVMLGAQRLGLLGEPPPRRLTRRLLSPLGLVRPTGRSLDAAAVLAHFAYGGALGGVFGLLPGRASQPRGLLFGLAVWGANYAAALPALGLMPPARKDRFGRPSSMIAAHLVYGAALAAGYRQLAQRPVSLRGKVVVICGGSRGMGRALARALVGEQARVAICARSADSLEQTRAWLEGFGAHVLAQVCDLRDEAQVAAFITRVNQELGPVDVLVANAATIEVGPLEALRPADFDAAMTEIFGSALRAALAVLPQMRARRRGTIAFVTSIGGKLGVPHLAPYSAAKFAEVGFAEALAAEVARDGVKVLTVMPGLMRTGSHLHASFRGDPERELSWFGLSAVSPLVSIGADRAARHIVRALTRGDRFATFTPAARLGAWLHDFAPELWSGLAGVAGRLLPAAPNGSANAESREGAEVLRGSQSAVLGVVAKASTPLSHKHNQ